MTNWAICQKSINSFQLLVDSVVQWTTCGVTCEKDWKIAFIHICVVPSSKYPQSALLAIRFQLFCGFVGSKERSIKIPPPTIAIIIIVVVVIVTTIVCHALSIRGAVNLFIVISFVIVNASYSDQFYYYLIDLDAFGFRIDASLTATHQLWRKRKTNA